MTVAYNPAVQIIPQLGKARDELGFRYAPGAIGIERGEDRRRPQLGNLLGEVQTIERLLELRERDLICVRCI